jgi:hypothetical protein
MEAAAESRRFDRHPSAAGKPGGDDLQRARDPATAVWQDELDRPHAIYHGDPIAGLT